MIRKSPEVVRVGTDVDSMMVCGLVAYRYYVCNPANIQELVGWNKTPNPNKFDFSTVNVNSMVRWRTISILLIVFSCIEAYAQQPSDKGPTGTLNQDYFNPERDPHVAWLIEDGNKYHLRPAIIFLKNGDLKRALLDLDFLLIRFVNHPEGLAVMEIAAKLSKDSVLPIRYYERALGLYPQYAVTHAQYGKYLTEIDQIDAGIQKLMTAIELDSKLMVAHLWLARAYAKKGNRERAREAAERAKSLGYKGNLSAFGLDE